MKPKQNASVLWLGLFFVGGFGACMALHRQPPAPVEQNADVHTDSGLVKDGHYDPGYAVEATEPVAQAEPKGRKDRTNHAASGVNLSRLGVGAGKALPMKNAPSSTRRRGSTGALSGTGYGIAKTNRLRDVDRRESFVSKKKPSYSRSGRRNTAADRIAPKKNAPAASFQSPYTPGHEAYDHIEDNSFKLVSAEPLSTFSADVDTASYTNLRRFIANGQKPPKDAVRIEEMVNYFDYSYPEPKGSDPFSVNFESASAPWNPEHKLVRIGLKTESYDWSQRPAMNLVFLVDVSGSMNAPNKLPLLQRSFQLLADSLSAKDTVAMVVYAGASGVVLPVTKGSQRETIRQAIQQLQAGGSTNAGAGIEKAYDLARTNFKKQGVNRVIIATDGDFNVGVTSRGGLTRLIQEQAKTGVYLTVLGFGMGNYKDGTLEMLADKGNGNYAYIDGDEEAQKVFKHQLGANLITVAKDVKFQLEFNPKMVQAYRLLGYENRVLAHQDFNNDKKDAGDIGAGHQVTLMYEVVPHGVKVSTSSTDSLKYQPRTLVEKVKDLFSGDHEMMNLKIRFKKPSEMQSKLIQYPYVAKGGKFSRSSADFRFQASVVAFGMILRDSPYMGKTSYQAIEETAAQSIGRDAHGYKQQFVDMVRRAKNLPAYKPHNLPEMDRPGMFVWRDNGPRFVPISRRGSH